MKITRRTKLKDIQKEYPWMKRVLMRQDHRFKLLDTPMGEMVINHSDIMGISNITGMKAETIIFHLTKLIQNHKEKN